MRRSRNLGPPFLIGNSPRALSEQFWWESMLHFGSVSALPIAFICLAFLDLIIIWIYDPWVKPFIFIFEYILPFIFNSVCLCVFVYLILWCIKISCILMYLIIYNIYIYYRLILWYIYHIWYRLLEVKH